jgi:hypothetical protein
MTGKWTMTNKASFTDTSQVPKGNEIFYRCGKCGVSISSIPRGNIGCDCGNVFVDRDYHRLAVEDFEQFELVEAPSKKYP